METDISTFLSMSLSRFIPIDTWLSCRLQACPRYPPPPALSEDHRLEGAEDRSLASRDWEAFKTKHLNILVGVLAVRKLNGCG